MKESMPWDSKAKARAKVGESVTLAIHQGISPGTLHTHKKMARSNAKDFKEHAIIVERWGILHGSAQKANAVRRRAREITKEKARGHGARERFGKLRRR